MYVHGHALFICQLPNCNLFTQHAISYWRDTTSELWTPVHSFTSEIQSTAIIVLYCFMQTNIIFHSIRLTLCFQQAGEIDNLTVKLGQSNLIVLCRFHVGTGIPGVAPHYTPSPTPSKQRRLPTGSITLVSYWGKTCCCTHHTFLLGFPTDVWRTSIVSSAVAGEIFPRQLSASNMFSGAVAGENRIASARGVSHTQSLYFVICLA